MNVQNNDKQQGITAANSGEECKKTIFIEIPI
jgi:hypothetical protein